MVAERGLNYLRLQVLALFYYKPGDRLENIMG
jgi:hypothetical protein